MCEVLEVSRSGYYSWWSRPESIRSKENRDLVQQIRVIHRRSRETYGSLRVTAELRADGHPCSKNRVARLMRENGIAAKRRRQYRVTTDSNHKFPVVPNHLNRQFSISHPNTVWVSDITYIWTSEGWLYLAGVLDLYSRMVVGWSMESRLTTGLTLSALKQALGNRPIQPGLVHHSDRGSQYAAGDYQNLLGDHGMICSMSRKADPWDNAPMESFFATLKTELVFHEQFVTREEAKMKIFEYIEVFYNRERRHSSLDYKSPLDFESTETLS